MENRDTHRPAAAPQQPNRTRRSQPPLRQQPQHTQPSARQQTARAQQPAQTQPPQRTPKKHRKKTRVRRLNRAALLIKLLTMLGVVAAVILSFLIFFKVSSIQVIDSKQQTAAEDTADTAGQSADGAHLFYTADEIIAASGIQIGDNLLLLNKAEAAAQIKQTLPYVSEVQIKRSLPNTVVITVTEYEITYAICDEAGDWWLISCDGRVLEQTTEQIAAREHITIQGMQIRVPQPGQSISPVGAEGADPTELTAKRSAVLLLLRELEATPEIAKHIVSVDVSSSYSVEMAYGTQYRVLLGKPEEELTYKFACLLSILETFERDNRSYLSGTIDLTFFEGRTARFLPSD